MSEFGKNRNNCGDSDLTTFKRFDPTLTTMLKYFPDLKLTVYTDFDIDKLHDNMEVIKLESPMCSIKHPRYGWRNSSYYRTYGLLNSNYDIAIAMDSDLHVMSEDVKKIEMLTKRFGVCIIPNSRNLVRTDTLVGADSDGKLDETNGVGYATNNGFMSLYTKNKKAKEFVKSYMDIRKGMGRGTVALWKAIWNSDFNPYMLPPQWCVCRNYCGIGDEIILHVGHDKVKNHYKGIIK